MNPPTKGPLLNGLNSKSDGSLSEKKNSIRANETFSKVKVYRPINENYNNLIPNCVSKSKTDSFQVYL